MGALDEATLQKAIKDGNKELLDGMKSIFAPEVKKEATKTDYGDVDLSDPEAVEAHIQKIELAKIDKSDPKALRDFLKRQKLAKAAAEEEDSDEDEDEEDDEEEGEKKTRKSDDDDGEEEDEETKILKSDSPKVKKIKRELKKSRIALKKSQRRSRQDNDNSDNDEGDKKTRKSDDAETKPLFTSGLRKQDVDLIEQGRKAGQEWNKRRGLAN